MASVAQNNNQKNDPVPSELSVQPSQPYVQSVVDNFNALSAGVPLPSCDKRELPLNFIWQSDSSQIDQIIQAAKQASFPRLAPLVERIESLQRDLDESRYHLPTSALTRDEVRTTLEALSPSERVVADILFAQAVGRIKRETTYLSGLEESNIATALEQADHLGNHYDVPLKINTSKYNSNGEYDVLSGRIDITLNQLLGESKDTLLSCWPMLVAEGRLPPSVSILEHELHHAKQFAGGMVVRMLDVITSLRLPFSSQLNQLKPNQAFTECAAFLLNNFRPYVSHSSDMDGIFRTLSHPEFSAYSFDDKSLKEMLTLTHNLFLLGMTGSEMATIVGSSRLTNPEAVMDILRAEEHSKRQEHSLDDDYEYALTLALLHAETLSNYNLLALRAQAIAREEFEKLIPQLR